MNVFLELVFIQLIRPGGVSQDLPRGLLEDIFLFCEQFFFRIDEIQDVLNNNRI